MKTIKYYLSLILTLMSSLFTSCDDMHDIEKQQISQQDATTTEIYILNEGIFNSNNSTLAKYNFNKTEEPKLQRAFFQTTNKRGLGDTANDMQRYGSKIYIVVNVSSQIEVIDFRTGKSIKRIPIFNEKDEPRQPRYIDFFENKAYVCSFDGTVSRIDTTTLEIEAITNVGQNPDGICITNHKIYVTNSGGLNYPNYDNSVSIIDINTFEEIKRIEVGINPYKIHSDSQGDVYVVTRGNYDDIGYAFHKIDSEIDELIYTFKNLQAYNFEIFEDRAYLYGHDFKTGENWLKVFDCITERIINEDFIKDKKETIKTLYSISINPKNNDVYLLDAQNYLNFGDLLCFNKKGDFKFRINEVGINPNHIIFISN